MAADEVMLASLGQMQTTSARRFTSLLSRSGGLVECGLVPCWAGKVMYAVRQHVMFAVVHQRRELEPARPELIGDVSPGLMRCLGGGLEVGLAGRGVDPDTRAVMAPRFDGSWWPA